MRNVDEATAGAGCAGSEFEGSGGSSFTALTRQVQRLGLMRRRYGYYWTRLVGAVAAPAVWVTLLLMFGDSWWQLAWAGVLAVILTQIAFLGHDAAHRQIFRSGRWNDWVSLVVANLLVGISYGWWRSKHTRHHANPNRQDHDPDISSGALVFTPAAATGGDSRAVGWLVAHQGWYFFPLTVLEGLSLHWDGIRRVLSRGRVERRWVELTLLAVRLGSLPTLLFVVLPPSKAIACLATQVGLFGLYLGSSFAPNHIGMPLVSPTLRLNFLRRQVLMSRNISGGRGVSIALGGLNYQIEHHLFPSMPRPHLRKVQPLVAAYCRAEGVPYTQTSLWAGVPAGHRPPQLRRPRRDGPVPVSPGRPTTSHLDGWLPIVIARLVAVSRRLKDGVSAHLWPLPALAVVVAVALGLVLPPVDAVVDDGLPSWVTAVIFGGDGNAASTVLDAVASSLITVTSLTFSLTVVTLQLASSQFSPRLLRTFTQDLFVQATLALFLATFAFSLTVLRSVRSGGAGQEPFVPRIAVTTSYGLAMLSVLGLVLFLAHLTRQIRVETMLHAVARDTAGTVRSVLAPRGEGHPVLSQPTGPGQPLLATSSGFLLRVEADELLNASKRAQAVLDITVLPGDFIVEGAPVGSAHARQGRLAAEDLADLAKAVGKSMHTGPERTAAQDVGFGLRQLGALQRHQGPVRTPVQHLGIESAGTIAQCVQHPLDVRGIGHHQVALVGEPVHDQVVEDAPVLLADHRVFGLRHAERADVADHGVVQRSHRLRPDDLNLAHVAEVEEPGGATDRVVLDGLAAIAQWHFPTREIGHGRTEPEVNSVQRGALDIMKPLESDPRGSANDLVSEQPQDNHPRRYYRDRSASAHGTKRYSASATIW